MERRSRSASPRRNNRNGSNGPGAGNAGGSRYYRRYSRSRSRSRERSRDQNSRRRSSRSRSRDRYRRGGSSENDLYRDLINDDYSEDKNYPSRGYDNRQYRGPGRDYGREYDRDYDRDRDRGDRRDYRNNRYNRRYNPDDRDDMHSDDSDESYNNHYYNKTPSNTIIVMGLLQHITEADIMSALIQVNMPATSIRLIRKRNTGASRGFAFVEFKTIDEAARWMELTQSVLVLQDQSRATLQYSHSREQAGIKLKSNATDWYCAKCGVFNFKRRFSCFKCYASREESERGGEGSDEVSNILTKKIMFRNLDALTNEESVLTAMQLHVPDLAQKVSKIMVSRDALTQTSRGICYLYFESLVDSMNIHNALTALEPPLTIDNREVLITYCMDHENRQIVPKKAIGGVGAVPGGGPGAGGGGGGGVGPGAGGGCGGSGVGGSCGSGDAGGNAGGSMNPADIGNVNQMASGTMSITSCGPGGGGGIVSGAAGAAAAAGANQYTLADVPRLAEYSAAMYASTPAESAHFVKYYTDYYISEINKGQFANLPSMAQVNETSANSGAAVALSAIQRKQKKMNSIETTATQAAAAAAMAAAQVKAAIAAQSIITPKGNDGKSYPTPDVSQYQYDETSGYYYDPTTGLYYDAHSQYYYNSETGAYLYWDQRKSTYVLATPASAAAAVKDVVQQETMAGVGDDSGKSMPASAEDETKKEKRDANKPDKVKVAKKIVKDMEKWAKQLNQKKDYTVVATPQPILTSKLDDCAGGGGGVGGSTATARAQGGMGGAGSSGGSGSRLSSAYADVGFSILEKKERAKLSDYVTSSASGVGVGSGGGAGGGGGGGGSAGGAGGGGIANKLASPYGSDSEDEHAVALASSSSASKGGSAPADSSERDCVDFQKLTCLLCKRAFQSLDILQKHLKMSNLHKENLLKYNMTLSKDEPDDDGGAGAGLSYRDRAKERRLKYGESDPPPPNRSRERFENEIKSMTSRQKDTTPAMPIGSNNVGNRLLQKMGWSEGQGLGRKNQGRTNIIEANARSSTAGLGTKSGLAPGDDYKTYIKKMMKSRYESV